jgi:hypothetical protein
MPEKKVKCLGWCNKEFISPDPIHIRFCKKCRSIRDGQNFSMREARQIKSTDPNENISTRGFGEDFF